MTSRGVRRKRRKRLRTVSLVLALGLCAALVCAGINTFVAKSVQSRILTQEEAARLEKADCILVLGAQVWADQSPSHMLEDRLRRGVALYRAKAAPVLLMSGDHGQLQYDEVSAMKQYAVNQGVPSADVFMDHAGFSTYESLYRARDIFQAKRILIVTQRYHLFRALYIARALGLEAYGVASDYRGFARQPLLSAREFAARIKDFGMCLLRPKPTYLGDKIPLSLSGDVTNDAGIERFEPAA
jgi:vancomycin permeability regulator SanA